MKTFGKRCLQAQRFIALGLILWGLLPTLVWAQKNIVVGGKFFTEQYLLSEIANQVLTANGFEVELKEGVGTSIARQSLETAQIDMYYEYSGTAYTLFYKQNDLPIMTDPEKVYDWVKQKDAEQGLIWLDRVNFNNTFTLLMQQSQSDQLKIRSLEDLAAYVNNNRQGLIFGVSAEFYGRVDGLKGMAKTYQFRPPSSQIKKMEEGLIYTALRNDSIQVGLGFATDGRIAAFNLKPLKDTKQYFPVYNPALVVRQEILEKYPEIEDIFRPISAKLNNSEMQTMNGAVDIDKKSVKEVATSWLTQHGIL